MQESRVRTKVSTNGPSLQGKTPNPRSHNDKSGPGAPQPARSPENEESADFLSPADELDAARAQSTALHHLLADSLTVDRDGTFAEDVDWGIRELIDQTDARLKRAIESTTRAELARHLADQRQAKEVAL